MFHDLRNFCRLARIAVTLARHNALFLLEEAELAAFFTFPVRLVFQRRDEAPRGVRLARALESLGPTFVKLGQTLSTRADLLGDETAAQLGALRDNIAPFPTEIAVGMVEMDFGKPMNELFSMFEPIPVAAASIAQVHLAQTLAGDEVAVKVLRPGIHEAFKRDLELMYWLARIIEKRRPQWRRLKPVEVVQTLDATIRFELDLRFEAAAAAEFRENLIHDEGFCVPKVYWNLTSARVMTLERVYGIPIHDREALVQAGHDTAAIVRQAALSFFSQVFRDGFFHADMHPGNLFVDAKGDIVAVDFGIMGRVDQETRLYLARMLIGYLTEDYDEVAQVHFDAGYIPQRQSKPAFKQACRSIAQPILNRPMNEISFAKLLAQLFHVTETFEMETQPQLLLLQKSMMMAEGIGRTLAPEMNMWEVARPLMRAWAMEHLGPKATIKKHAKLATDWLVKLSELLEKAEAALDKYLKERTNRPPT